jgi:hypothetical protein
MVLAGADHNWIENVLRLVLGRVEAEHCFQKYFLFYILNFENLFLVKICMSFQNCSGSVENIFPLPYLTEIFSN